MGGAWAARRVRPLREGVEHVTETAQTDDVWCWWPVDYVQNGQTGIACGHRATEPRVHPDCGCDTWLCVEHAADFDAVMEARDG